MRRLQRCIFALVIGVGGLARAQGVDTARIALDSAEKRMSGASIDSIAARRELDFALTNQQQAADAARNAVTTLDQVRMVLDDPAMVDRALADARTAAAATGERELSLQQVRERLDIASRRVEQFRVESRANFEQTPAYVQAIGQLDDAENRLANAGDFGLWQLQSDPEYQRLALMAAFARSRIQHLRDSASPDQALLARASRFWIEAEGELGTYEQWWLENDPLILSSRDGVERARQAVAVLDRRFEAELAANPAIIELISTRDTEQRLVTAALAKLNEARAAERTARANADIMRDRLLLARQQYDQLLAELEASRTAMDQAATSVWHADRSYRDVLDRHDRAQIDRDRAFRDYRRAQYDLDNRRDERDRINRDRDQNNLPQTTVLPTRESGLESASERRADPIVVPPTVPPPTPINSPPPPSRDPIARPPTVDVRSEPPRQIEPPRDTSSQQQRIDDVVRRSTDDARDRSAGSYRPSAGSDR